MKKIFQLMTMLIISPVCAAANETASGLSLLWAIPFVGVLLSIAVFPVSAPNTWHHHFGKIAAAWALAFMLPALLLWGWVEALNIVAHALLAEYIPFIILVSSLYIISGGIYIKGNLHGSPVLNTAILAVGTCLSSIMGTTGAAMLLIRPLLRANDNRKHKVHVVVFFIFLVANIGGSLTPLGDPPLFLGFLKGVPFFWTLQNVWKETALSVLILLLLFYCMDAYYYRKNAKEELPAIMDPTPDTHHFGINGGLNFVWILGAIGFVLMSGIWKSGIEYTILGITVTLQSVIRDIGLLLMAYLSWLTTAQNVRIENQFSFSPVIEVAKLFLAIFITIAPVITILHAGSQGGFARLLTALHDTHGMPINERYFWATGILSGFLDNAPTYLVFFNLAGGDVAHLTTDNKSVLVAISIGSVFMGALSYIGNAPNFMVKAIAEHSDIKMPSFFGYMIWSFVILLPLFLLLTVLFLGDA